MAKAKDTGPVIRAWYMADNPDTVATVAMREQLHWDLTEIKNSSEYDQAVVALKSPEAKRPQVVLIGEVANNTPQAIVTRLTAEGLDTFVPLNRNFLRNKELLEWIDSEKAAGRLASVRVLHLGGERYRAKPAGVFFDGSDAIAAAFRNLANEVTNPALPPQARK